VNLKKFQAADRSFWRRSGQEDEYGELEKLMTDVVAMRDAARDKAASARADKDRKETKSKTQAEILRHAAVAAVNDDVRRALHGKVPPTGRGTPSVPPPSVTAKRATPPTPPPKDSATASRGASISPASPVLLPPRAVASPPVADRSGLDRDESPIGDTGAVDVSSRTADTECARAPSNRVWVLMPAHSVSRTIAAAVARKNLKREPRGREGSAVAVLTSMNDTLRATAGDTELDRERFQWKVKRAETEDAHRAQALAWEREKAMLSHEATMKELETRRVEAEAAKTNAKLLSDLVMHLVSSRSHSQ
jgi:hypothetical protein